MKFYRQEERHDQSFANGILQFSSTKNTGTLTVSSSETRKLTVKVEKNGVEVAEWIGSEQHWMVKKELETNIIKTFYKKEVVMGTPV